MFLRCLSRDKLTVSLNYMLVCNTVLWMKLHNWMLICYPVTSTMKIRKQNPDLKSGFSLGKQKWWQHCFNGHYWRINCRNKTYVWSTLFLCFCCVLYWQLLWPEFSCKFVMQVYLLQLLRQQQLPVAVLLLLRHLHLLL